MRQPFVEQLAQKPTEDAGTQGSQEHLVVVELEVARGDGDGL